MNTVWRLVIEEPEVTLPWMSKNKRIAIGWGEIGDVRSFGSRDAMVEEIKSRNQHHPDHAGKHPTNAQHGSHSLHDFCYKLRPGDLVIISANKKRRQVWEVVGDYEYVEQSEAPLNYRHQREAQITKLNPDDVWRRAGKLKEGQSIRRTLVQCANGIE